MFIKHIPIAVMRAAATHCAAIWRQVHEKIQQDDWSAAIAKATSVRDHLVGAQIVALASLVDVWVKAASDSAGREAATGTLPVVDYELNLLTKSKIEPSLWLRDTAAQLTAPVKGQEPSVGAFFLPVVPVQMSRDHQGSPGTAHRDYGRTLAFNIDALGGTLQPGDVLDQVKATLHAIENRALPGALGLAFTLAMGWLEAEKFDDGDVKDLALLGDWLRRAGDSGFQCGLSELQLLAKLAYRVAGASGQRCQALTRHLSLADLMSERSDASDRLPAPAPFGSAWQEMVSAWEALVAEQTRANGSKFIQAFATMLRITADAPNLARMVREIGRLYNALAQVQFRDRPAVHGAMSQLIAAVNDAYTSYDPATIEQTSRAIQDAVTKMIETGEAESLAVKAVLPVSDLLTEISTELEKAVSEVEAANVAGAINILDNAKLSLSLISNTQSGAHLAASIGAAVDVMKERPDDLPARVLAMLVQATTVMSSSVAAGIDILQDFDARLSRRAEDGGAEDLDAPEDRELFDIFYQESMALCQEIEHICHECESRQALTIDEAGSIRRNWHTLKGSARMAGLYHLGEAAWEFESRLNDQLAAHSVPYEWVAVSLAGVALFNRVCTQIASTGKARVVKSDFLAALRPVSQNEPSPSDGTAGEPAAADDGMATPSNLPEVDLDFTESSRQPAEPPADAVTAAARVQDITPVEAAPVVAQTPAIEMATDVPLPAAEETESSIPVASQPELDPDVRMAVVSESRGMAAIIRNAAAHIGDHGVPYELVRAAHSIVGLSRIANLRELESVAEAVENWATYHYARKEVPSAVSVALIEPIVLEIEGVVAAFESGNLYAPKLDLAKQLSAHGSNQDGAESLAHEDEVIEGVEPESAPDVELTVPAPVRPVAEAQPETAKLPTSAPAAAPVVVEQTTALAVSSAAPVLGSIAEPLNSPVLERPDSAPAPRVPTTTAAPVGTPEGIFEIDESLTDDVDRDVLEPYVAEAEENLEALDKIIAEFQPGITSFNEMNRLIHTIKGGARLCGMLRLGSMLHRMEDATMASDTLSERDAQSLLERVQRSLDHMRVLLKRAVNGEQEVVALPRGHAPVAGPQREDSQAVLRVSPVRLEALSDELAQLRVTQDRVQRRTLEGFAAVEQVKESVARLQALAQRISDESERRMEAGVEVNSKSKDKEFDALEMDRFTTLHENTRRLVEASNDVFNIFETTDEVLRAIALSMRQQGEIAERLQGGINAIGLSGIYAAEGRLRAAVRQAAEETGKPCQIQIDGGVKIERAVMDKLIPAIEHLIRNSVAHGIEPSDVRAARGKRPQGLITLTSEAEGSYALITLSDDGGGIDFERVRAKAVRVGLVKPDQVLTERELTEVIFSPGFSTADQVTNIAGRGVGLDAVRDSIQRLGGRIETRSQMGKGVTFTLRVPTSAGYVSGLLLQAGDAPYIIPSALVSGVEKVLGKTVIEAVAKPGGRADVGGVSKRVYSIAWLCGVHGVSPRPRNYHNVVIPRGDLDFVVFGEHTEYVNNMPLKQFPEDLPMGAGILGYSPLSDGRIAVVINPEVLLQSLQKAQESEQQVKSVSDYVLEAEERQAQKPLVLVVDDSITVRTVSNRLLVKSGYRVETAENGAVALQKVAVEEPAVILMDIEMPVMDGFEALKSLKANSETSHIPVAIISSRNADKHRGIATELGASTFFGKPYRDNELLSWIEDNLPGKGARKERGDTEMASL